MLIVFKKEDLSPDFKDDRKSVWFRISYAEKYYSKDRFWIVAIMLASILRNSCSQKIAETIDRFLFQKKLRAYMIYFYYNWTLVSLALHRSSLYTRSKLNMGKMFIWLPGCHMNILCTFNFRLCTVGFSRLTAISIKLRTGAALNSWCYLWNINTYVKIRIFLLLDISLV